MVLGIESFLGGGGLVTVAVHTPAVQLEVMETLVRWANSFWPAAMLVPDFALAPSTMMYSPFQDATSLA
nr:hypothetical protein [Mycobacterium asiaticum]